MFLNFVVEKITNPTNHGKICLAKEIKNEKVPSDEKLFSIYEQHTDIIVKGSREIQFGHKINLSSGKRNLILSCDGFLLAYAELFNRYVGTTTGILLILIKCEYGYSHLTLR